ncbi:MAG: GTP-binding protein [Promethearchaeota archaeon]|nr:MAG: GTP-binding protein [Candidatus Lokiarchaeota archaeon]
MSNSGKKLRFKVTVIGDGRVGKTSLIKKFTLGTFEMDYVETMGAQFSKYDKEINGDNVRLLFWDIAGQRDFDFLRPSFYRESNASIIVYSLEENQLGTRSFEHIVDWYQDIKRFCGDIPTVLFANKIDLIDEAILEHSKIQEVVNKNNFIGYYVTSAKTGQGVYQAFNAIIEELYYKSKAI